MTYSVHPPLIAYFKFLLPLISSTVKYLKSGKFDLFKWIGINFNGYMLLKQLFFIQTNGHFLLDFFIFGFSKKRKLYDFFIRRNGGYVNVHYKSIVYIRAFKTIACWHHVLQVWFPHLAHVDCSRTRCSTASYIYQGCLFITTTMVAKNNILAHNRDLTVSRYLKTNTTDRGRFQDHTP